MINSKFDTLIDKLKGLKMTSEEKTDVYNRALSVIESIETAHQNTFHNPKPIKSTFVSAWTLYIQERKFVPTLVIAAVLLVTGGTSLWAEKSLPGDSLYSLKLNVNEQIQGLAAVTPEAKAKFALEVTDKRLKEVAILSSQGKLDNQTRKIIETQLAKQAGQVQNQVASLVAVRNVKAAQEVAVNYESSLKAHELILQKISSTQASTSDLAPHIGSIIDTVRTELATSTESRLTLQTDELISDANNKDKVVERLSVSKEKRIGLNNLIIKSTLSAKTVTVISAYNAQINQYITDAEYFVSEEQYPLALAKLQQVDQLISDAEAIISADVSTSVGLKFIVNEALSTATTTFDIKVVATSTPATTTPEFEISTSTEASSTVTQ